MSNGGTPRQIRIAKIVLVLLLLAFPVVAVGALLALRTTSNDPRQWLPRGFQETEVYDWFGSQFGIDEVVIVSWPGCTLTDPRIDPISNALSASDYFDRVRSGPSVVAELTDSSSGLDRRGALRRLRKTLIGEDGQTTCLILETSAIGQQDRPAAVAQIYQSAAEHTNLKADDLRLAGPTLDAAAIDAESQRLLFQLAGFSALISFVIAATRLGSLSMALTVLSIAGYGTLVSLATVYFSGGRMNLLMTMLPPLVYVLTVSAAVHLANYYRDAVIESGPTQALPLALNHGWLPCTMASITTAVGLLSLVTSHIDPIREFGIYSSAGVIVGVVVLLVLFPAVCIVFPPTVRRNLKEAKPHQQGRLIRFICRRPTLVATACLVLMSLCGAGLYNLQSTIRLQDRFLPSSDVIRDYAWLEKHVGPMVPLEIVVHFDRSDERSFYQRMELIGQVQSRIRTLDEPIATMSAVNLAPPLPSGRRLADVAKRRVINSDRTREKLIDARFVSDTENEQLWRISVRANAIGNLDYGHLSETLRSNVEPILQANDSHGTYTGIIPLIYKAQNQLLNDLFRSFMTAFGVIALVMVLMLRSLLAAAMAMVPNLFPAIVVFGSMEWLSIPIQIGSVMTASAALGIAVDDTVHFLTWFRRGLRAGMTRTSALTDAFHRCAGAMMHTTLICAGGLLVFAASSFVPILHFAWLMVFLLLAALVGDLILLPAILASPLGKVMANTKVDQTDSPPTTI